MNNNNESPFGEVIYSYSRLQAVADGVQVDVTKTAQEAGIKFPMFLTRAVFENYVAVPVGRDRPGRGWQIVGCRLAYTIRDHPPPRPGCDRLPVALYVRNDNTRAKLVKLIATCGALGY